MSHHVAGFELFDRRELLRRCACAALGGAGLAAFGRLELLQAAAAAQGPYTDYKALVCVFLFGGNDAFNMVIPRSSTEHAEYAAARQALAVPRADILPVAPLNVIQGQVGFHPSCPELVSLFDAGQLGVVANVGTLIQPVTRADYLARTAPLPPQLFSHSDQANQWQTARIGVRGDTSGWCGRVADVMEAAGLVQDLAVNVSINGANPQQTGRSTLAYNVNSSGVVRLRGIDATTPRNAGRQAAFNALLDAPPDHPLAREFVAVQRRAIANAARITDALDQLPPLQTTFPAQSSVASQLAMVARMIGIRSTLGLARQVFFVGMGGWDTHGEQATRHPALLAQLSQSLDAFQRALVELGAADSVVTFTGSDFGRTLTSNGDGSDHGWGQHCLVMGQPVLGRRIYGQLPTLAIDGPDDTRGGRLIPTTGVDEYAGVLARWFGVAPAELSTVFPNIGNFPARADLGFLP